MPRDQPRSLRSCARSYLVEHTRGWLALTSFPPFPSRFSPHSRFNVNPHSRLTGATCSWRSRRTSSRCGRCTTSTSCAWHVLGWIWGEACVAYVFCVGRLGLQVAAARQGRRVDTGRLIVVPSEASSVPSAPETTGA